MSPCVVGEEVRHVSVEVFRPHLAIMLRQCDYLVTGCLHSPGLVDIDMSGLYRYHALITSGNEVNYRRVGLRPAGKEHNVSLSRSQSARAQYCLLGASGIFIVAVSRHLFHIGAYESLHDLGVATPHIITVEM